MLLVDAAVVSQDVAELTARLDRPPPDLHVRSYIGLDLRFSIELGV